MDANRLVPPITDADPSAGVRVDGWTMVQDDNTPRGGVAADTDVAGKGVAVDGKDCSSPTIMVVIPSEGCGGHSPQHSPPHRSQGAYPNRDHHFANASAGSSSSSRPHPLPPPPPSAAASTVPKTSAAGRLLRWCGKGANPLTLIVIVVLTYLLVSQSGGQHSVVASRRKVVRGLGARPPTNNGGDGAGTAGDGGGSVFPQKTRQRAAKREALREDIRRRLVEGDGSRTSSGTTADAAMRQGKGFQHKPIRRDAAGVPMLPPPAPPAAASPISSTTLALTGRPRRPAVAHFRGRVHIVSMAPSTTGSNEGDSAEEELAVPSIEGNKLGAYEAGGEGLPRDVGEAFAPLLGTSAADTTSTTIATSATIGRTRLGYNHTQWQAVYEAHVAAKMDCLQLGYSNGMVRFYSTWGAMVPSPAAIDDDDEGGAIKGADAYTTASSTARIPRNGGRCAFVKTMAHADDAALVSPPQGHSQYEAVPVASERDGNTNDSNLDRATVSPNVNTTNTTDGGNVGHLHQQQQQQLRGLTVTYPPTDPSIMTTLEAIELWQQREEATLTTNAALAAAIPSSSSSSDRPLNTVSITNKPPLNTRWLLDEWRLWEGELGCDGTERRKSDGAAPPQQAQPAPPSPQRPPTVPLEHLVTKAHHRFNDPTVPNELYQIDYVCVDTREGSFVAFEECDGDDGAAVDEGAASSNAGGGGGGGVFGINTKDGTIPPPPCAGRRSSSRRYKRQGSNNWARRWFTPTASSSASPRTPIRWEWPSGLPEHPFAPFYITHNRMFQKNNVEAVGLVRPSSSPSSDLTSDDAYWKWAMAASLQRHTAPSSSDSLVGPSSSISTTSGTQHYKIQFIDEPSVLQFLDIPNGENPSHTFHHAATSVAIMRAIKATNMVYAVEASADDLWRDGGKMYASMRVRLGVLGYDGGSKTSAGEPPLVPPIQSTAPTVDGNLDNMMTVVQPRSPKVPPLNASSDISPNTTPESETTTTTVVVSNSSSTPTAGSRSPKPPKTPQRKTSPTSTTVIITLAAGNAAVTEPLWTLLAMPRYMLTSQESAALVGRLKQRGKGKTSIGLILKAYEASFTDRVDTKGSLTIPRSRFKNSYSDEEKQTGWAVPPRPADQGREHLELPNAFALEAMGRIYQRKAFWVEYSAAMGSGMAGCEAFRCGNSGKRRNSSSTDGINSVIPCTRESLEAYRRCARPYAVVGVANPAPIMIFPETDADEASGNTTASSSSSSAETFLKNVSVPYVPDTANYSRPVWMDAVREGFIEAKRLRRAVHLLAERQMWNGGAGKSSNTKDNSVDELLAPTTYLSQRLAADPTTRYIMHWRRRLIKLLARKRIAGPLLAKLRYHASHVAANHTAHPQAGPIMLPSDSGVPFAVVADERDMHTTKGQGGGGTEGSVSAETALNEYFREYFALSLEMGQEHEEGVGVGEDIVTAGRKDGMSPTSQILAGSTSSSSSRVKMPRRARELMCFKKLTVAHILPPHKYFTVGVPANTNASVPTMNPANCHTRVALEHLHRVMWQRYGMCEAAAAPQSPTTSAASASSNSTLPTASVAASGGEMATASSQDSERDPAADTSTNAHPLFTLPLSTYEALHADHAKVVAALGDVVRDGAVTLRRAFKAAIVAGKRRQGRQRDLGTAAGKGSKGADAASVVNEGDDNNDAAARRVLSIITNITERIHKLQSAYDDQIMGYLSRRPQEGVANSAGVLSGPSSRPARLFVPMRTRTRSLLLLGHSLSRIFEGASAPPPHPPSSFSNTHTTPSPTAPQSPSINDYLDIGFREGIGGPLDGVLSLDRYEGSFSADSDAFDVGVGGRVVGSTKSPLQPLSPPRQQQRRRSEQERLIRNAMATDIMMGVHGAEMHRVAYLKPSAFVVELGMTFYDREGTVGNMGWFAPFAHARNLGYVRVYTPRIDTDADAHNTHYSHHEKQAFLPLPMLRQTLSVGLCGWLATNAVRLSDEALAAQKLRSNTTGKPSTSSSPSTPSTEEEASIPATAILTDYSFIVPFWCRGGSSAIVRDLLEMVGPTALGFGGGSTTAAGGGGEGGGASASAVSNVPMLKYRLFRSKLARMASSAVAVGAAASGGGSASSSSASATITTAILPIVTLGVHAALEPSFYTLRRVPTQYGFVVPKCSPMHLNLEWDDDDLGDVTTTDTKGEAGNEGKVAGRRDGSINTTSSTITKSTFTLTLTAPPITRDDVLLGLQNVCARGITADTIGPLAQKGETKYDQSDNVGVPDKYREAEMELLRVEGFQTLLESIFFVDSVPAQMLARLIVVGARRAFNEEALGEDITPRHLSSTHDKRRCGDVELQWHADRKGAEGLEACLKRLVTVAFGPTRFHGDGDEGATVASIAKTNDVSEAYVAALNHFWPCTLRSNNSNSRAASTDDHAGIICVGGDGRGGKRSTSSPPRSPYNSHQQQLLFSTICDDSLRTRAVRWLVREHMRVGSRRTHVQHGPIVTVDEVPYGSNCSRWMVAGG